ncbi:MAG: hypothetical protein HXX16_17205 [Bacteroidales bacterium]|nr:hypothetical protein [Bacteroidales bacterium]
MSPPDNPATVDNNVIIYLDQSEVDLLVESLNIAVFFVKDAHSDSKSIDDFRLLGTSIINQIKGYANSNPKKIG